MSLPKREPVEVDRRARIIRIERAPDRLARRTDTPRGVAELSVAPFPTILNVPISWSSFGFQSCGPGPFAPLAAYEILVPPARSTSY